MAETTSARASRGQQAEAALKEFVGPALEVIRHEYTERLAQIAATEPWEAGKIVKLAMAVRITHEVEGQLRAVIADGGVAMADLSRARQIERIPAEKRKILGIALPTS